MMYTKLEDALNMLVYLEHNSQMPEALRECVKLAMQYIREYVEEGYRLPMEYSAFGY